MQIVVMSKQVITVIKMQSYPYAYLIKRNALKICMEVEA